MIKHIFRLIWNRKKRNLLMILEIFISFLVLFSVLSYVIYNYNNYTTPLGFNYENIWLVHFRWTTDNNQTVSNKMEQIDNLLKNENKILNHSFARYCTPFSFSGSRTRFEMNNRLFPTDIMAADEHFFDVLGMTLEDGRKLQKSDLAESIPQIMVNRRLVEDAYFNTNYLGQKSGIFQQTDVNIVGVYSDFRKEGEFSKPSYNMVMLYNGNDPEQKNFSQVFLKMKPGSSAIDEEAILNKIAALTQNWNLQMERLGDRRQALIDDNMTSILLYSMISLFLILNVALGLFGVLWYNIEQRKSELGLRRVMGAEAKRIKSQIIAETLVLTCLGIVIGLIFAMQVPILSLYGLSTLIYIKAMLFGMILISLIATVCSFYPSSIAAQVAPAMALRED
ncbi:MAG: ABC transporter permease [Calditrichaeota bacterium]|nr:ABC transporter permease [Calditrichota bacterium]